MEPLTLLALIFGGGWLLSKRASSGPTIAPAAPAGPAVTSSSLSPIQYQGPIAPARGLEDRSASPIETSGYIPPYLATPASSAVALDVPGTSLNGLSCGCGLGDARADRGALGATLRALRGSFRAELAAALKARQFAQAESIVADFRARLHAAIAAYQAQQPGEAPRLMKPSTAPNFFRATRAALPPRFMFPNV